MVEKMYLSGSLLMKTYDLPSYKIFFMQSILEISTHVCKTVTRREIAWYVTVHLGIISAIRGSSINSVF